MSNALINAYHWNRFTYNNRSWRVSMRAAIDAYRSAKLDVANGTPRYPMAEGLTSGWQPESDGIRYVENLDAAGLRFVGRSDEILNLRHTGYYADNDSGCVGGTYRGAVLQLPARDGCAVYLAAYKNSNDDGAAFIVDVSRTFYQARRNDSDDAKEAQIEAARAADRLAEIHAEREREYQAAWSQGQRYADLVSEETQARAERRKLRADLAKVKRDADTANVKVPASICDTLRAAIRRLGTDATRAASEAAEVLADSRHLRGTLAAAFNDGAGREVL